jgi:outer membrane protein assembly factor BamB
MAHILGVVMIFSLLSPRFASAGDQWPMYQANPAHTGLIPVSLDPSKFALRWQVKTGSLALNPVTAAGGRVFVSEIGYYNSSLSLYALDSGSGNTCWSQNFVGIFSLNPPSYSNGTVYVQTTPGTASTAPYLHAYDAATGTLVFRREFGSQGGYYYAPTIYKGKVYIDGGYYGGMYSFDGSTGNEDWFYYMLPEYDGWTPAVDENWAYAYMGYYGLYVLDRVTGLFLFQIPDPNASVNYNMDPAPVLGGLSDLFAVNGGRLIRFDLNARDISWANAANFSGQPTVANGIVYAISAGALGAYDQRTGTVQWTWRPPGAEILQDTIIATNSHLFVRSGSSTYCIDLAGHSEVWSYASAGNMSLGESTLYIAGSDGTLTAIGIGTPNIYVPESVAFDHADLGVTLTQPIPVSNVGDAPLQVQSIVSSSEEFVVQSPPIPLIVAPHQSVTIDVEFTPVAGGTKTGNLTITSNDPNEPEISVALGVIHTINAAAASGGQISPYGMSSVIDGDSLTLIITPNPGYRLATLVVDGATVGNPLTYTLNNIVSDHAITAIFAVYLNYFGLDDGDYEKFLAIYAAGGTDTLSDTISLDTTSFPQPSYIDDEILQGGNENATWLQVLSNSLFMKQLGTSPSAATTIFSPALPIVKIPLAAWAHWSAASTVSTPTGAWGTAHISATVYPKTLVSVPAGHFLAWPITYNYTSLSEQGQANSTAWTYWFAPYFGVVKTAYTYSTIEAVELADFWMGAAKVTTAPPIVTGTVPRSGVRGSSVTIKGFQFGDPPNLAYPYNTVVRIGNIDCDQILSWTDTRIDCTVPGTASSGVVTLATDTWVSNDTVEFKVIPAITNVTPSSGKRKSSVQIEGTAFGTVSGKVLLGTVPVKVTAWSDSSITFTVPAGMYYTTYPITVVNSQGQALLPRAFTVVK